MNSSDSTHIGSQGRYLIFAKIWLVIAHVVGLAGLNYKGSSLVFEYMSTVNLMLSFGLILMAHGVKDRKLAIYSIVAFAMAMMVEIIGVNTTYPFGAYHYTDRLGPAIWGVPVVIGMVWVLLSICVANVVGFKYKNLGVQIASAGIIMVAIDFFLERFAIKHQLWVWDGGSPPVQNYLSWFGVSVVLQLLSLVLGIDSQNSLSRFYIAVLGLFLLLDSLL